MIRVFLRIGKPLVLLASSYSTVVASLKTQIESNIVRIQ